MYALFKKCIFLLGHIYHNLQLFHDIYLCSFTESETEEKQHIHILCNNSKYNQVITIYKQDTSTGFYNNKYINTYKYIL